MTHEHPPKPEHLLANIEYINWRLAKLALLRREADREWELLVKQRMELEQYNDID